jgi:hypothetical protein
MRRFTRRSPSCFGVRKRHLRGWPPAARRARGHSNRIALILFKPRGLRPKISQ